VSQDNNQTGRLVPSLPLLQFLAWIAARRRSHAETAEAWRTSCPRLAVWEDALAEDLIRVERAAAPHGQAAVALTEKGAAVLKTAWRAPQTGPSPPADGVVTRGGLAEDS